MKKKELLDEINLRNSKTCTCTLKETATQAVPGEGSADAQILFIGEAPGKKEDIEGMPFIGSAGKFLDEMLDSIKLKRQDIYITNIVKYRPPDNRDPTVEEKKACQAWLTEQIACINPRLIVTLGRHAMEHFVPNQHISEIHGKTIVCSIPSLGHMTLYALYHPAAALYNGSLRATLKQDFLKIPHILKKLEKNI